MGRVTLLWHSHPNFSFTLRESTWFLSSAAPCEQQPCIRHHHTAKDPHLGLTFSLARLPFHHPGIPKTSHRMFYFVSSSYHPLFYPQLVPCSTGPQCPCVPFSEVYNLILSDFQHHTQQRVETPPSVSSPACFFPHTHGFVLEVGHAQSSICTGFLSPTALSV